MGKATNCYGTSYIFSLRAKRLQRRIRALIATGIIVPLAVGGFIMTYGINNTINPALISVAGGLSLLQLILSALALAYKWDDNLSYYTDSNSDNRLLAEQFAHLARQGTPTDSFECSYEKLLIQEQCRGRQDDKYDFSDKENMKGMRYGLFILGKACAGCGEVPKSMKPTKSCDICSNFIKIK